jgi:hypothetical protein
MLRRSLALVACCVGCGHAVPATSTPPARPAAAPPAGEARWTLYDQSGFRARAFAAHDVGAVLGGVGGERWLRRPDGGWTPAETMLPDTITGVSRRSDGWIFVGASGAIMRTREPLGAAIDVRAPTHSFRMVAAGAKALVGVTEAGGLVRSVDLGASWAKLDVSVGARRIGEIVMNGRGEGVFIAYPQLVMRSHDDGATWHEDARPTPIAARRLWIDEQGEIRFGGGGSAENALREAPWRKWDGVLRPGEVLARPMDATWRTIRGGAVVRTREGLFAIAAGGVQTARFAPDAQPELHDDGRFRYCQEPGLGAFEDDVVVACSDRTPGSRNLYRLFESNDGGRTFFARNLDLGDDGFSYAPRVFVGPRGAIAIQCDSSKMRVRPHAGAPFEHVDGWFGAFTAHERYGAFAIVFDRDDGVTRLFDVVRNEFRGATPEDIGARALGVDDDGTIFIGGGTSSGRSRVLRSTDGGVTFVPHGEVPASGSMAFAGRHGIVVDRGDARETADGGATWTPIANPAGEVRSCDARGCLFERGVRIGWGVGHAARGAETPDSPPAKARKSTTCRASGAWTKVGRRWGTLPASLEPAPDVRRLDVEQIADGTVRALLHRTGPKGATPEVITLLGAERRTTGTTYEVDGGAVEGGVVASRTMRQAGAPPSTELAWLDVKTRSVHRSASFPIGERIDLLASSVSEEGLSLTNDQNSKKRRSWFIGANGSMDAYAWPAPHGPDAEEHPWLVPIRDARATWLVGLDRTLSKDGGKRMMGESAGPELLMQRLDALESDRHIALGDGVDAWNGSVVRVAPGARPMIDFDEPPGAGAFSYLLPPFGASDEIVRIPRLEVPLPGAMPACADGRGVRVPMRNDEHLFDVAVDGMTIGFEETYALALVPSSGIACIVGWLPAHTDHDLWWQLDVDARDLAHASLHRVKLGVAEASVMETRALDCSP